nr:hypothetical protein [Tanacetum cinerariifolium]
QELRGFDSIFQSSKVMAAVVREARRMAPLDAPLLIEGETGTGKELLARQTRPAGTHGGWNTVPGRCRGNERALAGETVALSARGLLSPAGKRAVSGGFVVRGRGGEARAHSSAGLWRATTARGLFAGGRAGRYYRPLRESRT